MEKREYVRCALCNSDDTDKFCERAGLKNREAREVCNVLCKRCGLIYNNPMPSVGELKDFYSGGYLQDSTRFASGHEGAAVDAVKVKSTPKSERILDFIREYLDSSSRVLDIGCGTGTLLRQIKQDIGCRVDGVEPDATMAKLARDHGGIDLMENKFIDEFLANNTNNYDLIILRHVLEHLRNPNDTISSLRDILSETGYLFIVVPNAADFKPSKSLEHSLEYGHLYSFTPHTLNMLLVKNRMKAVKWSFDYVYSMQVVATSVENPVDAVCFEDLLGGADIAKLKSRLRMHDYYLMLFRLKRKLKKLFGLK